MKDPRPEGFPPAFRLRSPRDFARVRRSGRKIHTPHFIIYWLPADGGPSRLGLTVSRKVGGAVQRNRVKRVLREFYRQHRQRLSPLGDLSIIAKRGAPEMNLDQVSAELLTVLAGLANGRPNP